MQALCLNVEVAVDERIGRPAASDRDARKQTRMSSAHAEELASNVPGARARAVSKRSDQEGGLPHMLDVKFDDLRIGLRHRRGHQAVVTRAK